MTLAGSWRRRSGTARATARIRLAAQLYTRRGCHLCEVAEAELREQAARRDVDVELQLIDVDGRGGAALLEEYGERVPVLAMGGREYVAPLLKEVIARALDTAVAAEASGHTLAGAGAADASSHTLADAVAADASRDRFHGPIPADATPDEAARRRGAGLAAVVRHWLLVLNAALAVFLGGASLAPVLAATGAAHLAAPLYAAYHLVCHQWAFRSFFLFGSSTVYSEERLAQLNLDPFSFVGSYELGFKMAICERDVAIYAGLLAVGLVYARNRARITPLSLTTYAFLMVPMAVDGFTQLFGWRESTWELRVITGFIFGVASAWLLLPRLDDALEPPQPMPARDAPAEAGDATLSANSGQVANAAYSVADPAARSKADHPLEQPCDQPSPIPTTPASVQPRG